MSTKQFIALADLVRESRPVPANENIVDGDAGAGYQWQIMRDKLADFCAAQNSRFNRERWLGYIAGTCGPRGGSPSK